MSAKKDQRRNMNQGLDGCVYDLAVIGAGPAGCMAAIRAAQKGGKVVLLERNNSIGKKIMLSGAGRCNITNIAGLDGFLEAFGKDGSFYRSAFSFFFNKELIEFLRVHGLEVKVCDKGRVFPVSDKSCSVVRLLESCLKDYGVKVMYKQRVTGLKREGSRFKIEIESNAPVYGQGVVLATGGKSYTATGSSGDGFKMAQDLGHTIETIMPALVPLKIKENWAGLLPGVALQNVKLTFYCAGKKAASETGDILFTHFGISGPLVLDMSNKIVSCLKQHKDVFLDLDMRAQIKSEDMRKILLKELAAKKNISIKNFMKLFLPQRASEVLLAAAGIPLETRTHQITRQQREQLVTLLKRLRLTVSGPLSLEAAMVTSGGVRLKEIDPRSMESRIVKGLYFSGELIAACAVSGGYNMQQAFSTGCLAGEASVCPI